jgi:hypothetical protein
VGSEIERPAVRGVILDPVTITVRESSPGGPWRVYPVGEGPIHDQKAVKEKGVMLGGRFEDAMADAERVARENGFFFQRPSARQLL